MTTTQRTPTFLIIGAAKSGTSFLAARLATHPQAFVVQYPKELDYFSSKYNLGWDWYLSYFQEATDAQAVGESSPSYTMEDSSTIPQRIAEHLPEVRLIYIVRHPIVRLKSHWMEDLQSGFHDQLPFNQAIREQSHLVRASLYESQIKNYLDYFPANRILLLLQEELAKDPSAILRRCCEHIGIDPNGSIPNTETRVNTKTELRRATPMLKGVRNVGRALLGKQLTDRLPKRFKTRFNHLFGAQIEVPDYDPDTYRYVVDQVADDARAFLNRIGKPADYWAF